MNATVTSPAAAADSLAAVQKKMFRVTLTTDPTVIGQSPAKFIEILLGPGMSPQATAVLSNFVFSGGGKVTKHSMNSGATGDFSTTISMHCRPSAAAPQVLGLLTGNLTQCSFLLALDTSCSVDDWFTLSLLDESAMWFPTTAVGRPGLIGSVNWNTARQFTAAGYQGNGEIDGLSDVGFKATVSAF